MIKLSFSHRRKIVKSIRLFRLLLESALMRFLRRNWLGITTVITVVIACLTLKLTNNITEAAQVGDFLAGFAGALAFLWLTVSIRQQQKELELQRKTLEIQTKELNSMGNYAALDQVSKIIESALNRLEKAPNDINSPFKLVLAFTPSDEWNIILGSSDVNGVLDAYNIHRSKTAPVEQFISSVASAARLYLNATRNNFVDYSLSDTDFLYFNKKWIEQIPHVSDCYASVYGALESKRLVKPALESIRLAGIIAIEKTIDDGRFNIEEKQKIIDYLMSVKVSLPIIAK